MAEDAGETGRKTLSLSGVVSAGITLLKTDPVPTFGCRAAQLSCSLAPTSLSQPLRYSQAGPPVFSGACWPCPPPCLGTACPSIWNTARVGFPHEKAPRPPRPPPCRPGHRDSSFHTSWPPACVSLLRSLCTFLDPRSAVVDRGTRSHCFPCGGSRGFLSAEHGLNSRRQTRATPPAPRADISNQSQMPFQVPSPRATQRRARRAGPVCCPDSEHVETKPRCHTHTPGTHLLHREKQEGGPWPETPLLSQARPLPLETVWGCASSWSSHRRLGSGSGMMLARRALLSAIQPGALSRPMLFWEWKKMGAPLVFRGRGRLWVLAASQKLDFREIRRLQPPPADTLSPLSVSPLVGTS